jgi:hypothetical protein
MSQKKVTLPQAKITKKATSPQYCASYCLDSVINKTDTSFTCRSFDYCKIGSDSYSCSFYDSFEPIDTSFVVQDNPDCDFYASNFTVYF